MHFSRIGVFSCSSCRQTHRIFISLDGTVFIYGNVIVKRILFMTPFKRMHGKWNDSVNVYTEVYALRWNVDICSNKFIGIFENRIYFCALPQTFPCACIFIFHSSEKRKKTPEKHWIIDCNRNSQVSSRSIVVRNKHWNLNSNLYSMQILLKWNCIKLNYFLLLPSSFTHSQKA